MSGQSNGQTVSPLGPASSSSATRSSRRNKGSHALDGTHPSATSGDAQRDSIPPHNGVMGILPQENETQEELVRRSHGTKPFSGFLVHPNHTPDRHRYSSSGLAGWQNQDLKGKKRAENADLVIRKRSKDPRHHHTRPVAGRSPLAREILSSTPPFATDVDDGISREDALSTPSGAKSSLSGTEREASIFAALPVLDGKEPGERASSALGHDTDPAQIVNLALNLSESRRRNFSTGAIMPNNLGNKRLPSLGQHNATPPYNVSPSTGSLRQYLQQQRYASRNVSPRSSRFRHRVTSSAHSPGNIENAAQSTVSAVFNSPLSDGTIFTPSDATLARAEKARVTLELYYEYRRLLPNLPAIPISSPNKAALTRSGGKSNTETTQGFGRSYNPLQYIRNRRVRARERRMLDADADGWKELGRVRNWVDKVVAQREAGATPLHGYYALPVFEVNQASSSSADPSPQPGSLQLGQHQNDRLRRPRFDWSFAPWDLLADAYWMHQDDNLRHIEDANGIQVFSEKPKTPTTPLRTSRESMASPLRRSQSITRHNLTPDKLQSLFGHSRNNSTDRGRSQHLLQEQKMSRSDGTNSRDRRSRWSRNPIRSRDSSDSNDSLDFGARGYSRDNTYLTTHDYPESAALEKQMREMVKTEAQSRTLHHLAENKEHEIARDAKGGFNTRENPLPNGTFSPSNDHSNGYSQDLKHVQQASKTLQHLATVNLDRQKIPYNRRSLDASDPHATILPYTHTHVPSIDMNMSPSPSQPKNPKYIPHSDVFLHEHDRNKERHAVDEKPFEAGLVGKKKAPHPEESRPNVQNETHLDRATNAGTRRFQTTIEVESGKPRGAQSASTKILRVPHDRESRFRGFFKGRRIAQLMGNEVQKVGDKFRTKENINTLSRVSSVQSGYATDESDLGTDLSALESSPEDAVFSEKQIDNRGGRQWQRDSSAVPRPTYNHRRLPSFRSAFNKNEQLPSNLIADPNADHITRQQLAQRAQGRPSRFDQLAPPKIDVDRISPSSSPATIRSHTKDTHLSPDGSRRSSETRMYNHVHDAERRLQDVVGTPGTAGSAKLMVSSVSSFEIYHTRTRSQSNVRGQRQGSICDQSGTAFNGTVTKKDIARVEALLLSSGVKANEINRRRQEFGDLPPAVLRSVPLDFVDQSTKVTRSQGHMFAARILIENIDASYQMLRDAGEQFSITGVDKLHDQLRVLDQRLTHEFTPLVRGFADDADALSAELATTHTLNFKQLNDSIEILMRRRRRRFRWIRRGGYVLLEWTLLGIMWWAWLIVVLVRLVRCTVGAFSRSLRWLFWM